MQHLKLILFSLYLTATCATAQTLVLTHANIVDGATDKIQTDATITIVNGKIQNIATGNVPPPAEATVYDLKGKYLMPGLIDAHVHIRTFADAKRALLSGVTTARSMGVSHFDDIGMRELARAGSIEAPDILAAGYHVRHSPDEAFFMDSPASAKDLINGVKTTDQVRKMTQVMVDRKVDWIKVNATARAGTADTDPREPYYNEAQMKAIVETGARANIPVAAHAHGDEGARAAVLGGVKSIEHGTFLSDETLKLMVERGTYLVPTMAVVVDLTEPGGDYDNPGLAIRGRFMLPRIREMVRRANKLGVKIVAATDTGYGPNGVLRLGHELEEFINVGLTPLQVIQSCTSLAAEMLNLKTTGRIAVGLDADLLIIERNPLENIVTVQDPMLIINNGKVVLNRLEWKVSDK
jgi:imidazolonepropionase-like amidohydrolase